MLATGLLVVHDAGRGGEDDESERTRGEEQVNPRLDLVNLDVEARRDDSGLVEATVELDDNLARAVVVDDLEGTNVACTTTGRRGRRREE